MGTDDTDPYYFFGQSITGEYCKKIDWKKRQLDDPKSWPLELKILLATIFHTRQPMCIFWGEKHLYFYNDAYIPIVGETKHPHSQGELGIKVWAEIWPQLLPQIEQVMQQAKPTWHEDQLLKIKGKGEELRDAYFTYSYSPAFLANGTVSGVLVSCTETTDKVAALSTLNLERQKLKSMMEHSPSGMMLARGPEFIIDMVNSSWKKLVGDRNYIGKTWKEVYAEIEDDFFLQKLTEVYQTGEPYQAHSMKITVMWEGRLQARFYDFTYIRVLSNQQEPYGIYCECTDVTDQVHLQQRLSDSGRDTDEIVEGMTDAFFTLDDHWIIRRVNAQFEKVIKMKRHEVVGKSLIDLYFKTPEQKESLYMKSYSKAMKERKFQYFVDYYQPFNIWTAVYVYPKTDGGLAVFFREISEERRASQELQKAIQARDEFISIASHELNTPLTSLKLQTQTLQRMLDKDESKVLTKERISSLLQHTDKQTIRLGRLVDDMLDISRISSGKLKTVKENFDLAVLVKESVARMENEFASAKYQLPKVKTSGETNGFWDPLRLEQVVNNLLTNAIRYGAGKPISIEIIGTAETVQLIVSDQGIGIAPENQEKIFNRFERFSTKSEFSGLGLGLYLTQQIIRAHQGKIVVESRLHQGASFKVELPKNSGRNDGHD